MQADIRWTPPTGPLGRLIQTARERAAGGQIGASDLRARVRDLPPPPSFSAALRGSAVAVIAELKRRSPSRGDIHPAMISSLHARAYEDGGASALSVLTEPSEFGGSLSDLDSASQESRLPLLRKDFHVDGTQIFEARAHGASAVLLIARALEPGRLEALADAATEAGVEVLIEVRDTVELERALAVRGAVIGVNNRDLETLNIDRSTCQRLVPLVPGDRIAVAESGMTERGDVEAVARCGADAVLVGSSVSAAARPSDAVRALTGVDRVRRGP